GAEAIGDGTDHLERVVIRRYRDVGAELAGGGQAGVGLIDGDDVRGGEELGGQDRGEADRAGADDRDGVPGTDLSIEDPDLVRGGKDVGDHRGGLVADALGQPVGGQVGERDSRELGLDAVDEVTEDPAAAIAALAVVTLAAVGADATGGDAGGDDAVALDKTGDATADVDDGANGLVAEDTARLHGGYVALENVEVGPADRDGVDLDD